MTAEAEAVVAAARDMAARFQAGATLFALGNPADAAHVAVEFVHPVIVGKRALPALAVTPAQLRLLARPGDIAIGISTDVEGAEDLGLLTIALTGENMASVVADHVFIAESDDPLTVKELHVTTYHLLWELTHVFLENCSDTHCVTCSDEAIEVTVLELRDGDLALVDTGTAREEVSVALVEAEVGSRLLVHAKEAIARVE